MSRSHISSAALVHAVLLGLSIASVNGQIDAQIDAQIAPQFVPQIGRELGGSSLSQPAHVMTGREYRENQKQMAAVIADEYPVDFADAEEVSTHRIGSIFERLAPSERIGAEQR